MVNEEILVFRYTSIDVTGQSVMIAVDPFRVDRMLAGGLEGETLQHILEMTKSGVPQLAEPAMEKLLGAIQRAFGMAPVQPDGTGHNEKSQLRVLWEYLRYKAEVKKNIASPPTSLPVTEPASSPSQPKSAMPCGC